MLGPPRCLASPREASQCAGVPDPTRVKCFFHKLILDHITSLLGGVKPPGSGHRASRRENEYTLFWSQFRTFSRFFRIFFAFLGHLKSSLQFWSFFFYFERFWKDFGRILGGFSMDFGRIFCIFIKTADFVKYSVSTHCGAVETHVELLKIIKKSKNR